MQICFHRLQNIRTCESVRAIMCKCFEIIRGIGSMDMPKPAARMCTYSKKQKESKESPTSDSRTSKFATCNARHSMSMRYMGSLAKVPRRSCRSRNHARWPNGCFGVASAICSSLLQDPRNIWRQRGANIFDEIRKLEVRPLRCDCEVCQPLTILHKSTSLSKNMQPPNGDKLCVLVRSKIGCTAQRNRPQSRNFLWTVN